MKVLVYIMCFITSKLAQKGTFSLGAALIKTFMHVHNILNDFCISIFAAPGNWSLKMKV